MGVSTQPAEVYPETYQDDNGRKRFSGREASPAEQGGTCHEFMPKMS